MAQRIVTGVRKAPSFGELFGQALVKSVGAPIRKQREERAEFMKLAPSLIAQKAIEPTTSDDPNAIKFGKKPLSISGISFKPTPKTVDLGQIKDFFDIKLKQAELAEKGSILSRDAIEKIVTDPHFGVAAKVAAEFEADIIKAQKKGDHIEVDNLIAAKNAETARRVAALTNAFSRNQHAIQFDPGGLPQLLVGSGKVATAQDLAKLARGQIKVPTRQQVKTRKTFDIPGVRDTLATAFNDPAGAKQQIEQQEQEGELLERVKNFAKTPGKAKELGSITRKLGGKAHELVDFFPRVAAEAIPRAANIGANFISGLTGETLPTIPEQQISHFGDIGQNVTGHLGAGAMNLSNLISSQVGQAFGHPNQGLFDAGTIQAFRQGRGAEVLGQGLENTGNLIMNPGSFIQR